MTPMDQQMWLLHAIVIPLVVGSSFAAGYVYGSVIVPFLVDLWNRCRGAGE